MYGIRWAVLVLVAVSLAGCGNSLTDVTPRTNTVTAAPSVTPFCEAVERSQEATEPVSRLVPGRRVDDIDAVADRVRAANQQVSALAPQEIRADFERLTAVTDRQLQVLENNNGDAAALARDRDVAREASDADFLAASRRVQDYVRRTC